jgi:hypothetical protein
MGAIVIMTRYDEGTESVEVATSDIASDISSVDRIYPIELEIKIRSSGEEM